MQLLTTAKIVVVAVDVHQRVSMRYSGTERERQSEREREREGMKRVNSRKQDEKTTIRQMRRWDDERAVSARQSQWTHCATVRPRIFDDVLPVDVSVPSIRCTTLVVVVVVVVIVAVVVAAV